MAIWPALGFSSNPYDSRPLRATEEGDELLIGREVESRTLRSLIDNTTLHPTLEGANGVGKTSLVRVNAFRSMQVRKEDPAARVLLPIDKILQIHGDAEQLYREALFAVAQALIEHEAFLEACNLPTGNLAALKAWLNSPLITGGGGGAQVFGVGANVEVSREANTGEGFVASGLEGHVKAALVEIFPDDSDGALIGVIDNVELLGTSREARHVLEAIRDTVLDLPRVRWVLCGALGIVRSAVTSARLQGWVSQPVEVAPVADEHIEALIEARLSYFANREDPAPPIDPAAFRHLYDVCNHNLRDSLKYAQSFAVWLDVSGKISADSDYRKLLEEWLASEAEKTLEAITLQPRAWQLFDDLAEAGGSCAPSDHDRFGFNTPQQMRTNFAALERAHLIKAEIDEEDQRRKTVNISDKGWVVHYAKGKLAS